MTTTSEGGAADEPPSQDRQGVAQPSIITSALVLNDITTLNRPYSPWHRVALMGLRRHPTDVHT